MRPPPVPAKSRRQALQLALATAAVVTDRMALPRRALAADRPPPPLPEGDPRGISGATKGDDGLLSFTFTEQRLGLTLGDAAGGGVQVKKIDMNSPGWEAGVLPLSRLVRVDGRNVTSASAKEAGEVIKQAGRPVTLAFDVSEYAGLSPDQVVEKAANAEGFETARVGITPLEPPPGGRAGGQCGYVSRESDVLEIEYTATVEGTTNEFDSSERRSGRPFALMLGNADALPGLEIGLFEMCIGERRRVRVPAQLGFGSRGSRTYGVPPDAVLLYDVKLVSINGQTDPGLRREDLPDEQRFQEPGYGPW